MTPSYLKVHTNFRPGNSKQRKSFLYYREMFSTIMAYDSHNCHHSLNVY